MDNPVKKWRRDKENKDKESRGWVKIISETGEEIGELKFNFNPKKSEIKDSKK